MKQGVLTPGRVRLLLHRGMLKMFLIYSPVVPDMPKKKDLCVQHPKYYLTSMYHSCVLNPGVYFMSSVVNQVGSISLGRLQN